MTVALIRGFLLLLWTSLAVADWAPRVKVSKGSSHAVFKPFDDSEVILSQSKDLVTISKDGGETWKETSVGRKKSYFQIDDNYPNKRAFIISWETLEFYMTTDQGETWSQLNLPLPSSSKDNPQFSVQTNPSAENDLLVTVALCDNEVEKCKVHGFVTSNLKDFKPIQLPETDCIWLKCQYLELTDSDAPSHDIFCDATYINREVPDHNAPNSPDDQSWAYTKLFASRNGDVKFEPLAQFENLNIHRVTITSQYVIVSTLDDSYNSDSSQTIWVSQDGKKFQKASLPTDIRGFYHVSELSRRSKALALLPEFRGPAQTGTGLALSDSEGLRFSHVSAFSSDSPGFYTFSDVGDLEGVIVASFMSIFSDKKQKSSVQSKISFDGGLSWSALRVDDVNDEFDCDVNDPNSCSLTVFLTPYMLLGNPKAALPGMHSLIGVVGDVDERRPFSMQTFITTNGGETWRKAFDFPAAIQYGDNGNIMVALPFSPDADGDPATELYYSLDQGDTWIEYELKQSVFIEAFFANTLDGSGTKFTILGTDFGRKMRSWLYSIDFSDAFDSRKCGEDDMEEWFSNSGNCIGGIRRKFTRRISDAECLVRETYKDLEYEEEICQCTDADYECSPEFYRSKNGECELDFNFLEQSHSCRAIGKGENLELAPIRLQRGNRCEDPLDIDLQEVDCNGLRKDDKMSPISVFENVFQSELKSYQYFNTKADETVILRNSKNEVFVSYDSGKELKRLMDKVTEVVFNPYFNTSAYIFDADNQVHITDDRARSFETYELPEAKQIGFPLSFHAKDSDTFIYYGGKNCDSLVNPDCHAVAYITRDGGNTFTELISRATNCEFVGSLYEDPWDSDMILCSVREPGSIGHKIVTSANNFEDSEIVFENALGFVSAGEYTVVAVPHEDQELRAFVTVDGKNFAEAKLPAGLSATKQQAFTILGSQKGAIFFHLTTHMDEHQEFGALMKSNSNGTSFVTLERAVSRGPRGFVDFEKVEGLEGIIMINTVSNAEELKSGADDSKLMKSKISFNDGADWTYLQPPNRDSEGKKYDCNPKDKASCSLNLHGYTERRDPRDTYSSGSAVGFIIGVGNVGEYLLAREMGSTFMSVDAGFTWREIQKGAYQWEFGDRGSIVVLVKDGEKTDSLTYSVDSGKTWHDYKFSSEEVYVEDLITTPEDSAMRFIIIAKDSKVTGKQTKIFTIDFANSFDRQCRLQSDYTYHSFGECLFGHQAEYLQKINDKCYNGAAPVYEMKRIAKTCSCTRMDFECDYNYFKAADGTCKLVEGTEPLDGSEICEKYSDLVEFFEPTGYRKIPLSTCKGGLELDRSTRRHACPGFEEEFKRRYQISGGRLAAVIIIPILVFIGAAWFVYDRGVKRNGGFSRFGEIRLGDEELIEQNGLDKVVNAIVKVGVLGFSGLVTAKQLTTRGIQNTWQRARSRLSGNMSGPTYLSLNHDQFLDEADELLAGHDEDANDLTSFLHDDDNYDIATEDEQGSEEARPYTDEVNTDEINDTDVTENASDAPERSQ
ncbi:LAME_0C05402g1_1 [Lachancea meyersii CBS 8951]|uniref:LAME_0C05402g1_1 n=1 Tax=Lachancea meyersii CBS 8951 TaxID=1266667 RepID=A0A1G4J1S5_9SACH|nr:LAME_0C05402g1_1 [Lachancea meyersii CBS 8951]